MVTGAYRMVAVIKKKGKAGLNIKKTAFLWLYFSLGLFVLPGEESVIDKTDPAATITAADTTQTTTITAADTAQEKSDPQAEQQETGEIGYASWYAGKFQGRLTANGEIFDTEQLTAAHKTLPFNTLVKVTDLTNNLSVIVRINDRGPFIPERIIDLSHKAAQQIELVAKGIAKVRVDIIGEATVRYVYTLQVGAYAEVSNALSMQQQLQARQLNALLEKTETGLNRVVIRQTTKAEAEKALATLASLGLQVIMRKEIAEINF